MYDKQKREKNEHELYYFDQQQKQAQPVEKKNDGNKQKQSTY